ncbi:MAG TPA: glycosyltransferase family 87 protein, partial [Pseudomonadales bacterium]|nr:glycosyltransferase family 87 protein [Pseudomonadales bacterium]
MTLGIGAVVLLALLALVTWGNYRFAKENPGGNDFLVHWMGTRSLIMQGLNPYSDEVALKIQNFAYGHPAEKGEHELRVAYPLYSIIVFLPFSLISNFNLARAFWMTILEAGIILLTLLSLRLARWRVKPVMLIVLLLFSVFWYHGLRPLINGNAVILVALGLAGGFLALKNGADELAGVLFAFTTIKPQVVVLVLAFVVIWGLSTGRS